MMRSAPLIAAVVVAACSAACERSLGTGHVSSTTSDTAGRDPATLYAQVCASCHEGGVPRAPHSVEFQMMGPEHIYTALTTGVMQPQGAALTDAEKRQLSEFLGGRSLAAGQPTAAPKRCEGASAEFDYDAPPPLDGWGMSHENRRFIPAEVAKLPASEVPKLTLKWAFGFPSATRARSQPTIAGGAIYVGSQDGTVYALDFATGCVRWTFRADGEVRNSPVVESWKAGDASARPRVFIGDFTATAYALDARTGELLWKSKVDPHPRATLTGSPRLFENRLYFTVSSTEWAAAADPSYECCTFRGGVAAIDTDTGHLLWRAYTIPEEPQPTGRANSAGARLHGPAGAPTWGSPTIDVRRRRIYVGTGESYTSPAAPTSDAVVAFDLDTGKMLWHYQSVKDDAWNMACFIGGGPNCPPENGPDLDIGAPPVLGTLPDGRDVILVGQKSADVFALDPDANGRLLWKRRIGRGGYAGGVHWGMSLAGTVLFAPNADTKFLPSEAPLPADPGLHAIDIATGRSLWFAPATDVCPPDRKPACDPGLSAAVTSIPGVVFAGSFDGHLRAYDAASGRVLWDFDTAREFDTVNGVPGRGGSIESAGPVVVDGVVLVNSGYLFGGRMAGNVLLAFAVPTD